MPQQQFEALRKQYPVFSYNDYTITRAGTRVRLTFHFSVKGLCRFAPTTEIETENLNLLNDPDSPLARRVVFALGMVELVSYWKAACPKRVEVRCGALSDEDVRFWKRLYFRGLSEFFYRNGVHTSEDDFMELVSVCKHTPKAENPPAFRSAGLRLVPVGGGKDSCVTASLLHGDPEKNRFFTVNDQKARTDTVLAAGYTEKEMVRAYRTIDRTLLDLNAKGFLNGHTPFSAIVAFLSYYCAYLVGATDIVLSNEASANESNIAGTEVNHQYSKSYDFECDLPRTARGASPMKFDISACCAPSRNCRSQNSLPLCRSTMKRSAAATAGASRMSGAASARNACSCFPSFPRLWITTACAAFSGRIFWMTASCLRILRASAGLRPSSPLSASVRLRSSAPRCG